jgi:siroheme synthase-like protein
VRPTHLAAMLDVAGRDVLIVGGGAVAARRAATLLEAGATVRVVSPTLTAALRTRHRAGEITWEARGWRPGDCRGAFLVVVASADPAVNAQAAAEARGAGALVNDAQIPGRGDLHMPALIRRGRLQVAVSSGGGSPVLATFIRDRIAGRLGPEVGRLADMAARIREQQLAAGVDGPARQAALEAALPRLLALLAAGREDDAERLATELCGAAHPAGEPAWS